MSKPHLDFQTPPTASAPETLAATVTADSPAAARGCPAGSTGTRLLRTAECLKALLQAPTANAGLNESRYNVLDALRRKPSATCSQTELATYLLQSESNLSTLLDRMKKDGLISRVRSESDRRVALIGLSTAGRDALARADQARHRAVAPVLRVFDERLEAALGEALELLRRKLEETLGIARRRRAAIEMAEAVPDGRAAESLVDQPPDHAGRRRTGALEDGPQR